MKHEIMASVLTPVHGALCGVGLIYPGTLHWGILISPFSAGISFE